MYYLLVIEELGCERYLTWGISPPGKIADFYLVQIAIC